MDVINSILSLPAKEAKIFFLKSESYYKEQLPTYINFSKMLSKIDAILLNKDYKTLVNTPQNYENLNYVISTNKDGKYEWRPFELINPIIYIDLVQIITNEENWNTIVSRFTEFSLLSNIKCTSIPVFSSTFEKDKAKQLLSWWEKNEQKSLELSLDFNYLFETDISNCYGSIYTHSIAWALHSKKTAKEKRNDKDLLGNIIDNKIQSMQYGQTNGIPQGSVLMDLVAEIVLGAIDEVLSKKLSENNIKDDYYILRYVDDYKIFVNNPQLGERILKYLTETVAEFGMKINSQKTKKHNNIILSSIKKDKLAWIVKKQKIKNLQKQLLLIYNHTIEHPHSGSVIKPLENYYKQLIKTKKLPCSPETLIAITTDMAYRNPRLYSICTAMLSLMLAYIPSNEEKRSIIEKIKMKFNTIPNTSSMLVWLQRITLPFDKSINYDDPLCKLIDIIATEKKESPPTIWNLDWVSYPKLKKSNRPKKYYRYKGNRKTFISNKVKRNRSVF